MRRTLMAMIATGDDDHQPISAGGADYDGDEDEGDAGDDDEGENAKDDNDSENGRGAHRCFEL